MEPIDNDIGVDPKYSPEIHSIFTTLHLPQLDNIKAAIARALPEKQFELQASQGRTNMLRSWSGILVVREPGKSEDSFKQFIIKKAHAPHEIKYSERASRLGIGPTVIFTEESDGIFVEEYFKHHPQPIGIRERSKTLTIEEQMAVGYKMADVEFKMFEDHIYPNKPALQGGDYTQHLLLVGEGKDIKPLFTDWGQTRIPQSQGPEDLKEIDFELSSEFKILKGLFSPLTYAHFLNRLKQLAPQSRYGNNFYLNAYNARKLKMETEGSMGKINRTYFQEVENILKTLEDQPNEQ